MISKVEAGHPGVYKAEDIAHALSFLSGAVLFVLGLLRLGWLIEFIPYVPISAFVTSASITIISTQLPTVLGIRGINTRESPYKVYVNVLKNLHRTELDAAIGITSIILLWCMRSMCAKMEIRQPHRKRLWSLISSLRLTFVILLYTFISWLVHRTTTANQEKFRIVGQIEKGFSHAGVPPMDPELFSLVASELPAIVVILIVEHIAIAKSFGRTFNYTIVPSQEMIAQGAANILSPFVGGYVCTGSFGASAVLSKAAVRTPLAGLFSAIVLVLALYALTGVFYYIPNAALAGLILHCTVNLITPPKSLYGYWQLSPPELLVWVSGVAVAFFTNLETAIYISVGLSFAMLLVRMAKSPGNFRGSTNVTRVTSSTLSVTSTNPLPSLQDPKFSRFDQNGPHLNRRNVYLPYDTHDNYNPKVKVEPAYPGVFIYRFIENFNYINQAFHIDHLTTHIKANTRRTCFDDGLRASDHLWCDPLPTKALLEQTSSKPILRAVVLDLSTVNFIDITSVNGLIDLRSALDRHAAPAIVEWHFAGVYNRWTRRALAFAGFGAPNIDSDGILGGWVPTYTVATPLTSAAGDRQMLKTEGSNHVGGGSPDGGDEEKSLSSMEKGIYQPIFGVNRPFFHVDLHDAVDAAVRGAARQDECEGRLSRTTTD